AVCTRYPWLSSARRAASQVRCCEAWTWRVYMLTRLKSLGVNDDAERSSPGMASGRAPQPASAALPAATTAQAAQRRAREEKSKGMEAVGKGMVQVAGLVHPYCVLRRAS